MANQDNRGGATATKTDSQGSRSTDQGNKSNQGGQGSSQGNQGGSQSKQGNQSERREPGSTDDDRKRPTDQADGTR